MHMQRFLDDIHKDNDELVEPILVRLSISINLTVQQIMIESSTANSSGKPKETQYPKSHYIVWRDSHTSREEIDLSHECDTLIKINLEPGSQTMVQSLQHFLNEHTFAI